jgi:hypothetical protein
LWIWDFSAFWNSYKYKNMDKITYILKIIVRWKYFEAGIQIKNPIKNSYQDGLGRTTQALEHVVVVHILIWDKRKSQINKCSDISYPSPFRSHNNVLCDWQFSTKCIKYSMMYCQSVPRNTVMDVNNVMHSWPPNRG